MNTIYITTSQNIDLEYELGSLGDRILGRILDGLILSAYMIIVIAVTIGFSGFEGSSNTIYLILILLFLPVVFYDLVCEIFLNGQSFGKKIMNIKVISLTGEQPTLSQYLIRWLFRLIDFTLSSELVALIMVAVTEKKQRLGDIIAGTALVKTTPRSQLSHTLYVPTDKEEYHLTYPEVINLKDSDIELVKEVLRNVHTTGNTMLALQAKQKIEQVLHIMSMQSEPVDFLKVILLDYNYVTSQL